MWSNDGSVEQANGVSGEAAPSAFTGSQVVLASTPAPIVSGPLDGAFDVPAQLMERIELCKFLAEADLLPRALAKRPANVLLLMHKAMALRIPLSVAIEHLHVIDGKVGHSAELLRALIHRHGHTLRWPTKTDKEVIGELTLRHDPNNPRRERFSLADATRMKLTGKDNWQKDPESMMVARCTTRLVSRHCPEVAVALGNLSGLDFDDDPAPEPIKATANIITEDDEQHAARDLFVDAQNASSAEQLKSIGQRARDAGLLEYPVDDKTTLQEALLRRLGEIAEARRGKAEPANAEVVEEGPA